MSTDPGTPSSGPTEGGGRAWVRPVALVVSCLIIGFVGGWILRGDEGPVTVLPPSPEGEQAEVPVITTPGPGGGGGGGNAGTGTTGTGTSTAPATTAAEEPAAPPDRSDITLAVLNGTNVTGLAAQTAGEAEALGYVGVTAGNAPTTNDPSIAYFRPGRRAAAQRVARDLRVGAVQQLPRSGPLAQAAPDAAEVVLVLGPG